MDSDFGISLYDNSTLADLRDRFALLPVHNSDALARRFFSVQCFVFLPMHNTKNLSRDEFYKRKFESTVLQLLSKQEEIYEEREEQFTATVSVPPCSSLMSFLHQAESNQTDETSLKDGILISLELTNERAYDELMEKADDTTSAEVFHYWSNETQRSKQRLTLIANSFASPKHIQCRTTFLFRSNTTRAAQECMIFSTAKPPQPFTLREDAYFIMPFAVMPSHEKHGLLLEGGPAFSSPAVFFRSTRKTQQSMRQYCVDTNTNHIYFLDYLLPTHSKRNMPYSTVSVDPELTIDQMSPIMTLRRDAETHVDVLNCRARPLTESMVDKLVTAFSVEATDLEKQYFHNQVVIKANAVMSMANSNALLSHDRSMVTVSTRSPLMQHLIPHFAELSTKFGLSKDHLTNNLTDGCMQLPIAAYNRLKELDEEANPCE